MKNKTALVVGVTGLVGREVLNTILDSDVYSKVIVLTRSSIDVKDNRLEEIILNFEQIGDYKEKISAHHYYSCLGTTLKKAGSKEFFKRVECQYPIQLGKIAEEDPKCEKFLHISSFGANAQSILFYNSVKGETDDMLQELDLKSLHLFKPSLLLGYRKDFRIWEELGKLGSYLLSFFIIGSKFKFWSIEGKDVAKAMFYAAQSSAQGTHVHKPLEIKRIAKKKYLDIDLSTAES